MTAQTAPQTDYTVRMVRPGPVSVHAPTHGMFTASSDALEALTEAFYGHDNGNRRRLAHWVTTQVVGEGDYYDCDVMTLLVIAASVQARTSDLTQFLSAVNDDEISAHMRSLAAGR